MESRFSTNLVLVKGYFFLTPPCCFCPVCPPSLFLSLFESTCLFVSLPVCAPFVSVPVFSIFRSPFLLNSYFQVTNNYELVVPMDSSHRKPYEPIIIGYRPPHNQNQTPVPQNQTKPPHNETKPPHNQSKPLNNQAKPDSKNRQSLENQEQPKLTKDLKTEELISHNSHPENNIETGTEDKETIENQETNKESIQLRKESINLKRGIETELPHIFDTRIELDKENKKETELPHIFETRMETEKEKQSESIGLKNGFSIPQKVIVSVPGRHSSKPNLEGKTRKQNQKQDQKSV